MTQPSPASRRVGAVVIGRNEGPRLVRCLESLRGQVDRVVYVDSDSRDGSAERAEGLGVDVVRLRGGRLTAARGRQAGVEHLLASCPELAFVQFVDGDCTVQPGWIAKGLAALEASPKTGAVFGRRRESRTGESLWSRLIDLEWEMPAGVTRMHGGDVLYRVAALREIGGWSADLIAGEDPDISFRLRDAGWEIRGLREEMTSHDIAMTRLGQFWKRGTRSGHAYAEVGWRHRRGAGRYFLTRRCVSILAYGLALPLVLVALAVVYWPAAVALGVLAYGRLGAWLYLVAKRQGADATTALAYAALSVLGKFAAALGVARFFAGLATGRRSALIEYKGPVLRAEG